MDPWPLQPGAARTSELRLFFYLTAERQDGSSAFPLFKRNRAAVTSFSLVSLVSPAVPAAKIEWPVIEGPHLARLDLRYKSLGNHPQLPRYPFSLLDRPIRNQISKVRSASLDQTIQRVTARTRQPAFSGNVILDQARPLQLSLGRLEYLARNSITL